jgi:hypothetical protein
VDRVQSQAYPPNCFYFQTLFFEQAQLNTPASLQLVMDVADSLSALAALGLVHWRTFTQAYSEWETNCGAQPFQWACDDISTGTPAPIAPDGVRIAPTLFSDRIQVLNADGNEYFELHSAMGGLVWHGPLIGQQDLSALPAGPYLLVISEPGSQRTLLVVKQ